MTDVQTPLKSHSPPGSIPLGTNTSTPLCCASKAGFTTTTGMVLVFSPDDKMQVPMSTQTDTRTLMQVSKIGSAVAKGAMVISKPSEATAISAERMSHRLPRLD